MIHYYRKLVAEDSRMQAFLKGIETAVTPESVVCEIGAGLGTYSLMASRAGAAKVYAIEESPVIDLAKKIHAANRTQLGDVTFIKGHSSMIHLPDRVDVAIYENYDCQGLTAEQEATLADALHRFMKPDGIFIPSGMHLYWAPLEAEGIWQEEVDCLGRQGQHVAELDYSLTRELAVQDRIVTSKEADRVLGRPAHLTSLDFTRQQSLSFVKDLTIELNQKGTLHGFGSWADFIFPGGGIFSSSFDRPATSYGRAFFPAPEPIPISEGDVIHMKVSVRRRHPSHHVWTWWGQAVRSDGLETAKWQCSTLALAPFQVQDVLLPSLLNPSDKPVLNLEGRLRKHILESVNGRRGVEEIAEQTYQAFNGEVESREAVLNMVLRLLKKCAKRDPLP